MDYLFHFDAEYCSEEDSDYVPSDTETSSDTEDLLSDVSDVSDLLCDFNLKDEIPTHIRIKGGKTMLKKELSRVSEQSHENKQIVLENLTPVKNLIQKKRKTMTESLDEINTTCPNRLTRLTRPTRVRKEPVRYQA